MTRWPWRRDLCVIAAVVALLLLTIVLGGISSHHSPPPATPTLSGTPGPGAINRAVDALGRVV